MIEFLVGLVVLTVGGLLCYAMGRVIDPSDESDPFMNVLAGLAGLSVIGIVIWFAYSIGEAILN